MMKSVEFYDNLVLCPVKESECIRITSSSTIYSKTTKPCSEATNSPTSATDSNSYGSLSSENNNFTAKIEAKANKIQFDGKTQTKKTQMSSFDKDYNNSTTCSENKKSFKNGISSNYSSRAFYSKDEEDDIDIFAQQRNQRVSQQNKEEIANMKKNKKKSFFSFLCC